MGGPIISSMAIWRSQWGLCLILFHIRFLTLVLGGLIGPFDICGGYNIVRHFPWVCLASCVLLGIIVTYLAWIAQRLVSLKISTKYALWASCSALRADDWNWKLAHCQMLGWHPNEILAGKLIYQNTCSLLIMPVWPLPRCVTTLNLRCTLLMSIPDAMVTLQLFAPHC